MSRKSSDSNSDGSADKQKQGEGSEATDVLATIRLPVSLVEELKVLVQQRHYMDVSEAIRSILRQEWEQHSDPLAYEVRQLRSSIETELRKSVLRKTEQRLLDEFKKVRDKMREELE